MMIVAHIHPRTSVYDDQTVASAKNNWLQVLRALSSNPGQRGYLAPSLTMIFNNLLAFPCWYFPNLNSFIIAITCPELSIMIK
jgi:hypothetical protein